jgi:hypothetical protein
MPNISVVEILKVHGKWIRSKEFHKLVSQKLKITERQAYNLTKRAKEILKITLPDRTVIYGLSEFGYPTLEKEKEILSFKDAFLLQCFKELEDISKVGAENPALAVNRLRLFISRLPDDLKTKLEPLTEKAVEIIASKQNEIEKQFFIPSERKPKLYALYFQTLKVLIEEISETLRKYQQSKNL